MEKRREARGGESGPIKRTIKFGVTPTWRNSIPYYVMKGRGWKEVESNEDWDFFYADVGWIHENITYAQTSGTGFRLADHQRVNHFPNHVELTRKDLMAKNIKRALKQAQKEGNQADMEAYEFQPITFTLPAEGAMMLRAFKEKGGVWIMKPVSGRQGKGIFLVSKPSQIDAWLKERVAMKEREGEEAGRTTSYVAQKYIHNPYLVGGKKFDLRIYALVLSYAPLKVYLYREGFARFTNATFSLDKEDLSNAYIHLTNHAVQKKDADYDAAKSDLKWSIHSLKTFLSSMHGQEASNTCFGKIQHIITQSLKSVQNVLINDKHCVELYGYDIMIDQDLKPWLIEVNASPALSSDNERDYELKFNLIEDFYTCLDLEKTFNGQTPKRVGGFDLIYDKDTVVRNSECPSLPSGLGIANNRIKSLKRLKKTRF
mmetsp:Transcript_22566/g.43057  ORF Transcript_22566/g.43057 Transcript_22566/m.43057 type:complete len:429 (-) Transcript_22566:161-1447(-)|eukprot:CAMPEP_0114239132 /NCGR_PEP_ID=MMETSP0058-20121206/8287_1 /TAXON_ID=36894 /ORGANISM="Pyramimonas parkeae, CCMP726" /LENGTH=428 /DNA_ID=CAMNT_0001351273 /DNA_START=243 /DNA_END=1529 /DNA_ORIENTATION=-